MLVVDDSSFMRRILIDIINKDDELEVVDFARNGQEALEKVLELKPDVMTLDIEMPILDGLKTLEKVMKINPMPVIMLSSLTQSGTLATIRALEKGAVDFIAKPNIMFGNNKLFDIDKISNEIINKIKNSAKISRGKIFQKQIIMKKNNEYDEQQYMYKKFECCNWPIVAIGTSTGGPKALHTVMSNLTEKSNTSILIVQHMPPGFTNSLAKRLNDVSNYVVKEAENGEEIKRNCAYVAPGDYHMEVSFKNNKLCIVLNKNPHVNGHRPSVDVMFNSVAKIDCPKIGVIMTGMGSDGAKGMLQLKKNGSINFGENEESCVVYGMPKVAYMLGAVDYEVPLCEIANCITRAIKKC